jgi:hypothetical protein
LASCADCIPSEVKALFKVDWNCSDETVFVGWPPVVGLVGVRLFCVVCGPVAVSGPPCCEGKVVGGLVGLAGFVCSVPVCPFILAGVWPV